MDVEGTIKRITDTVQVSDKFKKRDVVIETPEQYPQTIALQATQDRVSILDNFKPGQYVKVYFNLRRKEYDNKQGGKSVFVSLDLWRIEAQQAQQGAATNPPPPQDDLPF